MYIHFNRKYQKVIWLLIGFLTCCFLTNKVLAQPVFNGTQQDFDFNNFSLTYNNHIYTKQSIFDTLNNLLSSNNKSLEDYTNIFINVPNNPNSSSRIFVILTNPAPTGFYANNYNTIIDFLGTGTRGQLFIFYINLYNNTSSLIFNGLDYNTGLGDFDGNTSVYSNYYFDFSNNENTDSGSITNDFYFDSNLLSTSPSYLNGYKKITLTSNDKYYMLSGLNEGSVFIPIEDFIKYGGRLSYYDNDLDSQPYNTYIQDYVTTEDGLYVRQDFNLADYYGADWVMFSKYIYLEGEDDISYDIWVPNDIYESQVTITPNSSGGNTFDFDYIDSNGDIQSGQVDTVDLSQDSPLFNQFLSSFSQNTFGLASIITAPLSIIQSLDSSSCTPLNLPLPFIGGTLTLPCMYSFYQNTFGNLFTLYQTITFGIVSYWVCVRFLQFIKEFKDPDHDEIEVVDL